MSLKEGDIVPSVTFKARIRDESLSPNPFKWKDVQSEDLFQSKRCVLFALPGGMSSHFVTASKLLHFDHSFYANLLFYPFTWLRALLR
jgi:peroxiredoxin